MTAQILEALRAAQPGDTIQVREETWEETLRLDSGAPLGRNVTIEVLEYLDAIGVTRREGDARQVLRRAAELFG